MGKVSNEIIGKSVQNRLQETMKQERDDEVRELIEKLENANILIENFQRRHEEDLGYIQHYRIRITELEKALKENNIEIP